MVTLRYAPATRCNAITHCRRLSAFATTLTLMFASACGPGEPAKLVAGVNDTLIVNNLRPVHIPIHALDAFDRIAPVKSVHYEWISGDSLKITSDGTITCIQNGDATIRATLNRISKTLLLRCRPVKSLHIAGPMQLVVGDSSQRIAFEALGVNDKPVDMIAGSVSTMHDTIVAIEPGLRLRALAAGGSLTTLYVGDLHARVGVHTLDRVSHTDGLRAKQRHIIMHLQLAGGGVQRWPLPPGIWMLTMLPYEDETRGLRLRVEGANCTPQQLTRRRILCETTGVASLVVSHPSRSAAPALSGEILVERDHN